MASVRISIARLKPGMFVVDTGISWIDEPHLYQKEGLITAEAEIKAIRRQGFAEVCYDPTRSQLQAPPEEKAAAQTPLRKNSDDNATHQQSTMKATDSTVGHREKPIGGALW